MGRGIIPGVSDVVFLLVLASILVGGRFRLLNDPGTPWHERLGRDILQSGRVPRCDTLTYTRAGEPWVDQSWLFDLGLAALVRRAGWPAAAGVSAFGIAAVYAALARGLCRDGYRPLVVLTVGVLAAGIGSIHFLIRPHLVTLACVLVFFRVCQAQHERGGNRVFLLPVLTVLWANVHGGFLAGPVILGTAALGHLVSGPWDAERRRGAGKFLAAGVLCGAAALVNPYGPGLYRHVGRLLVSSGVTALIDEYQPVPFGMPNARAYEWVLLALIALPALGARRMSRYELAHTLVWLHLSLASVRHAPLFALATAPGLARMLDGLLGPAAAPGASTTRDVGGPWPALAALGLGVALAAGAPIGVFDPNHWPIRGLAALNRLPTDTRVFHEQDWGGFIAAESDPVRRTYLDDRFELFGKAFILRYVNALAGGPDWDAIARADDVRAVWLRPDRGLARRLAADRGWTTRHRDDVSVLYERATTPPAPGTAARGGGRPSP